MFNQQNLLFLFFSILPVVSSADSPRLDIRQTADVTFTCSASGLWRYMHTVVALQIARKMHTGGSQGEQDVVLATADVSGFRASSRLNPLLHTATDTVNSTGGCMHKVVNNTRSLYIIDGNVSRQRGRDSWLQLTIPDVTTRDSGTYLCRALKMEHQGDLNLTVVLLGSVEIDSSSADTSLHGDKSFSAHFSRGVDMVCEFDTTDISATWNVSIIKDNANTVLTVSCDNEKTNKVPHVFFLPASFTGTSYILNTHLVNVSCQDQGRYMCSVQDQSDRPRNTAQQNVSLHGCHMVAGCSYTDTVSAGKEINQIMSQNVHDDTSVLVGVGTGMTLFLGVAMLSLYLLLKFRRHNSEILRNSVLLASVLPNRGISSNSGQSHTDYEGRLDAYHSTPAVNTPDETSFVVISLHGQVIQGLTSSSESITSRSSAQHLQVSSHAPDLTDLRLRHVLNSDMEMYAQSDEFEDECPCKWRHEEDTGLLPCASCTETHPLSDNQVGCQGAEAASCCGFNAPVHAATGAINGTGDHLRKMVTCADYLDAESDTFLKPLVVEITKPPLDNSDYDDDDENRQHYQRHPEGVNVASTTLVDLVRSDLMPENNREGEMHDESLSAPIQATDKNITYSIHVEETWFEH